MKLQKCWLVVVIAAPLLIPGHGLAAGRTTIGYLSSVTSTSLVMDGISYRLRPNQEEKNPVEVQCAVQDKKIDCEELARINQRNHAKAEVSFDSSGYVIRVQILDVPK